MKVGIKVGIDSACRCMGGSDASKRQRQGQSVGIGPRCRVALHLSALCVSVAFACFAVRGSTFIVARTAQQELRRLVREVLASPTRRRDALLADILDQLDQVGPQTEENLLAAWPPPLRTQLLDLALDQRSAAGAILAATSGGTCDALDDVGLQSRLLSTMAWCAPRSLRFRLQQFMISGVHTVGRSHAEALRDGDEAAQQALQAELLQLLPSLRRRGVSKLHSMLRAHMQDAADPSLPREEMAAATLDATVLALCTPFVTPLVECGGRRDGLDASALATNFAAMAGSVPLLRLMLDQGCEARRPARTDHAHAHTRKTASAPRHRCVACPHCLTPVDAVADRIDRFGRDGAYPRCLGCPQCCLDDGVMPTGNKAMWFSPQHAAAFAGQLAELEWLERHQPPYRGNRRWPFPARTLLFNASDSTRCDADAPGGLDARGGVPSGSGSEHSGSGQRGGNDSSGDWNGVVESKNSLGDATSNCEIHSVAGVDVAADPRAFFERYVLGGQPVIVRGLSSADGSLAQLGERLGREALLAKLGATEWEIGEIP